MSVSEILTGHTKASARVANGRLVLSLPDAETPAVWVLDLNDTATAVLRLENDKQGFYVIRKHGGKGTPETVAVYRNRRPAERALKQATCAMDHSRNHEGGRSRKMNVLIVILFVWFALSRFWDIDQDFMRAALMPFFRDDIAAMQAQMQAASDAADPTALIPGLPAIPGAVQAQAPAKPALGVPQSADEFLKAQEAQPDNGLGMFP